MRPGGTVWLTCPECDGEIEVEFGIEMGEGQVLYPTDDAYPGQPPRAVVVANAGERRYCNCALDNALMDQLEEENQDRMFDSIDAEGRF